LSSKWLSFDKERLKEFRKAGIPLFEKFEEFILAEAHPLTGGCITRWR
jgi:hypothetical protein